MIGTRTRRPARERTLALGFLAVVFLLFLSLFAAKPAHAATFTVNRTGDAKDANLANAACDANAAQSGKQCTLRAAIQEANDTQGADLIRFNIVSNTNVKNISPASALPTIEEAVTIDGYTQAGASKNTLANGNDAVLKIQLNGTNAGAESNGFAIRAADSKISGLVINRFGGSGVVVSGPGATGNRILGNLIGTNAAGTVARGNGRDGVNFSATNNTVGGTQSGARNVISGNDANGVQLLGGLNTANNEVLGNFIGTDMSGTADLGNAGDGVFISNAFDNTVGGTVSGARNTISGNGDQGIEISGSRARGNKVQGNFIGTTAPRNAALGNGDDGVSIFNAPGNVIGGATSAARNVICGNTRVGVKIVGAAATDNTVLGNFIGTSDGASDLGNGKQGVSIFSGASGNTIGGTLDGTGNRIAFNGEDGVSVSSVFGDSVGNSVLSNAMFFNDGLGIDLVGGTEDASDVTNNDPNDSDTGANNLQNFPVITSARNVGGLTIISGTLDSNPSQTFRIQCLFTGASDPSGHGESLSLLQQRIITTDPDGDASFTCAISPNLTPGKRVTATATNTATGDTSELSRNVTVVDP